MIREKDTVVIVGVGNEFRQDDAVGLVVVRRLATRDLAGVRLMEMSGDCTGLLSAWKRAGKVIVIDAVSSGTESGTIHRTESGRLSSLGNLTVLSTHGFGLIEAVGFAEATGELPAELVIYGIEGQSFDYGVGLSPPVAKAVNQVVERVLEEVLCTNTALPGT
jgi:hydrogenase maturation protease